MMFAHWRVALSILLSVFAWTSQVSAGWVIDQVTKVNGDTSRQQVIVQANRMKYLDLEKDGKPTGASMMDLDAQTITVVDYEERHYTSATIEEWVQQMQKLLGRMGEAMQEMQKAMKEMPPEQRKQMEEMMRSQMDEVCRERRIDIRKTDQQATIAGYPAVRYDVLSDGKPEAEIWIAKGITAWQELDRKKLEYFLDQFGKLADCSAAPGGQGVFGAQRSWMTANPEWRLVNEGYPARTVKSGGSGVTVEVVKAESRTVPAGEFQPPAGFTRKTLADMMQ